MATKQRRKRWAEHENAWKNEEYKILVGKSEGLRLLGRYGRRGIILEWILKKEYLNVWVLSVLWFDDGLL